MYPPAYSHDPIVKIFEDVYLVQGSIRIGPGMRMNRNMIILKEDGCLTLINPVRMSEQGLAQLEELGEVRHVMRLGDFHGLDDQFYTDHYGAQFWCQPGQATYQYPKANHHISSSKLPPVSGTQFFIFEAAKFPEAALFLAEKKLLVTTDSVQYWPDWRYTSLFTRFALWVMGFRLTLFIGGPWLKRVTPRDESLQADFERLMALDFDHLVAAHGYVLRNEAKPLLEKAIAKTFHNSRKAFSFPGSACG